MALQNLLIDISPLKESRAFRFAYAARAATVLVTGMLMVAASVQIYGLTQSSVSVAMLNLLMAIPTGVSMLIGGVLSDRMDRRTLMLWSRSVYVLSTLIFLANTLMPTPALWPIYLAGMIGGAAGGISIPAMMSATPALVGRDRLAAAAALSGLVMHVGAVFGPLLAGVLINGPGLVFCYLIVLAGVITTPLLLRALPPLPPTQPGVRPEHPPGRANAAVQPEPARKTAEPDPGSHPPVGTPPSNHAADNRQAGNPCPPGQNVASRPASGPAQDFLDGLRHLVRTPLLRNLLLIDLGAVVFATPLALLPEWGHRVLGQAHLIGLLYAAPAVGAIVAALGSGWTRTVARPGRAVILAVICWGLALLVMGFSQQLHVSLAMLAVMGASDTISKMLRMTLMQRHTPNHLLGRLSSLWMTQASLSTAAGNMQMGMVAGAFSPAVALMAGGSLCLLTGLAFRFTNNALDRVGGMPSGNAPP